MQTNSYQVNSQKQVFQSLENGVIIFPMIGNFLRGFSNDWKRLGTWFLVCFLLLTIAPGRCVAAAGAPDEVSAAVPMEDEEKPWLHLYADGAGGAVRLVWTVDRWPAKLSGFHLKKRVIAEDGAGKWQPVSVDLLAPSVELNRNWTARGLNAAEAAQMTELITTLREQGTFDVMDAKAMRRLLSGATPHEISTLSLGFFMDFRSAFIAGFGFIDHDVRDGQVLEYGLFADYRFSIFDGWKPVAVCSLEVGAPWMLPEVTVNRNPLEEGGWVFDWRYPRELINEEGAAWFNVYRTEMDSDRWEKLNADPVGLLRSRKDAEFRYVYADQTAERELSYRYRIAAVSLFTQQWDVASFVAAPRPTLMELARSLPKPVMDSVELLPGGGVQLDWEYPEADAAWLAGFLIERSGEDARSAGKWLQVSELLPSGSRMFVDESLCGLEMGEDLSMQYRILAVIQGPARVASDLVPIVYRDMRIPPPVAMAACGYDPQKKAISIVWEPAADDDITAWYMLRSDVFEPDEMAVNGAFSRLTNTQVSVPVFAGGRTYCFEVVPCSAGSVEGPPAPVSCFVPHSKMARIDAVRSERVGADRVQLSWDYPEDEGVQGFRIYQNGQLVADEYELAPLQRQWVSPALVPNREFRMQVSAVALSGVESRKSKPVDFFYLEQTEVIP